MIEDKNLTKNFTLWQMTQTSYVEFLERNRMVSEEQIAMLTLTAQLLETIHGIIEVCPKISSGYRCKGLNDRLGSTDRSQHLKCEAVDFITPGLDLGQAFRLIWRKVKDGELSVGQFIYETANRDYGTESWLHISLGAPFRTEERCNQILRMENGLYRLIA